MLEIKVFQREDYDAFAGAESWMDGDPLIATPAGDGSRFIVVDAYGLSILDEDGDEYPQGIKFGSQSTARRFLSQLSDSFLEGDLS